MITKSEIHTKTNKKTKTKTNKKTKTKTFKKKVFPYKELPSVYHNAVRTISSPLNSKI